MYEQVSHSHLDRILDQLKPEIRKRDLRHFYTRLGANFYAIHSLFKQLYGRRDDFDDNLLRLVPCDVLLTTSTHVPELDVKADESIHWTPEAEARLERAPDLVRGLAKTAILRLALEQGHSVVTSDLVGEAMDRFMPKYAGKKTQQLAEALALEKAREQQVSICQQCSTRLGSCPRTIGSMSCRQPATARGFPSSDASSG